MNIYDFDGTIYRGDSTLDFYFFCLRKKPLIIRYLPIQIKGFILYLFKKISKTAFKEAFFNFLKDIDESYILNFFKFKQANIFPYYLKQKKADDLIISASPEFLIKPFMDNLGIKTLIASKVDFKTGNFISLNCYGKEKVRRLEKEVKNFKIEKFYSDSLSDEPLAKLAKEAYLVDKKGRLKRWPNV